MESGESLQFDDLFIRYALETHFGADLLSHSFVSDQKLLFDVFGDHIFFDKLFEVIRKLTVNHLNRSLEDILSVFKLFESF